MARIKSLTALKVSRVRKPGFYPDGGGLYLQVTLGASGNINKSWLYRYQVNGRERYMGLGPLATTTLVQARGKATEARQQRERGVDPIDAKHNQRAAQALAAAKSMTFDQCRDGYITAHRASWRNARHAQQWTSTLETYVTPVFGKISMQAVDTGLVMKVLEPIWSATPETASRVRGRIESIINWARARGYRKDEYGRDLENPARWRGHLDDLLPKFRDVQKRKREREGRGDHHAAMPYHAISAFAAALQTRSGTAARALEFTILTAARHGEVLGAKWDELDLRANVWTIPASRMKGGREHRVPLSKAAVAVIKHMGQARENEYVFPGNHRATLSMMAMPRLLQLMGGGDFTIHGFRSTFRDWVAECTDFSGEVAEAALAHVVRDKVEAAYRRGDLLEKRRELMDAWAEFCIKVTAKGEVVPLQHRMLERKVSMA
jgi:integrase